MSNIQIYYRKNDVFYFQSNYFHEEVHIFFIFKLFQSGFYKITELKHPFRVADDFLLNVD